MTAAPSSASADGPAGLRAHVRADGSVVVHGEFRRGRCMIAMPAESAPLPARLGMRPRFSWA